MNKWRNFEWGLFLPMVFLTSFGIMVILSTSPPLAREQIFFALLGLIVYFAVAASGTIYFRSFAPHLYVLNIFLLALTLFLGFSTKGVIRWIPLGFGGIALQTSELSKFFMVVALAAYFCSRWWRPAGTSFILSFAVTIIAVGLVYLQPDLGTSLVLFSSWVILVLAAGVNWRYPAFLLIVALLLAPVSWSLLKPYQRERVAAFLNPGLDPLGSGYHILQSKIAIGSGQLWGRGFGRGTQSHLLFLPEYHNDFIFAALSEEWGLLGSLLVIFLFTFLFLRIIKITAGSTHKFEKFLCLGVFGVISVQFIINVGMNLGLAPVTGVPLPLVSSGGSSLVTTSGLLGLVQSVALRRSNG